MHHEWMSNVAFLKMLLLREGILSFESFVWNNNKKFYFTVLTPVNVLTNQKESFVVLIHHFSTFFNQICVHANIWLNGTIDVHEVCACHWKETGHICFDWSQKMILAIFITKAFKLGLIQANPDTQQIPQHPCGTRTALLKPSGAAGSDWLNSILMWTTWKQSLIAVFQDNRSWMWHPRSHLYLDNHKQKKHHQQTMMREWLANDLPSQYHCHSPEITRGKATELEEQLENYGCRSDSTTEASSLNVDHLRRKPVLLFWHQLPRQGLGVVWHH